jgi:hypothetical protein
LALGELRVVLDVFYGSLATRLITGSEINEERGSVEG